MQVVEKPRVRVTTHGDVRLPPVLAPEQPKSSAQYMRGEDSPFFFNWTPALRDQREDVQAAYTRAAARAIDAMHNSGWLAGAVEQALSATVGNGLRIAAQPDADALRWDKKTAATWARMVERRFESWAKEPIEVDAAGKQSLGQLARSVTKSSFTHGETLGLLPSVRRSASETKTKVKLLPAHKLTQDTDGMRQFQGVRMTAWGLPVSYSVMMNLGQGYEEKIEIPARDGLNRAQVLHIFDGEADQVRGITSMAPALRVIRQYDQLADATLQASLIQAIFAATVESDAPTEDILRALQDHDEQKQGVGSPSIDGLLQAKTGWYKNTKIDLGRGGRIAHLFPGEKLAFNASKTPNDTYEAFAKFLLREVARCLGLTFETLTGDYSGATYSSVRMSTSETWPIVLARRENIVGRFYQIVFETWLDEQVSDGKIEFPGGYAAFRAMRRDACRASWRGPAKPQADDLKTAKAFEVYKRMGIMSDERICADLGYDWEDEYEQRQREMEMRTELGLPETDTLEPVADPIADKLVTQD